MSSVYLDLTEINWSEQLFSYGNPSLRKGDDHPEFIHAFNAYTPPATIEGDLVYVHYARVEDLRKLKAGRPFELFIDLNHTSNLAQIDTVYGLSQQY